MSIIQLCFIYYCIYYICYIQNTLKFAVYALILNAYDYATCSSLEHVVYINA